MSGTETDGSGIVGQIGLNDDTSPFNSRESQIDQALSKISTVKPVKVMGVTNDGGLTAVGLLDVMPLINLVDGLLGNSMPQDTIFQVPYFRLQGGQNAIIIDPIVGDLGFIVVSDRDISVFKQTKAAANPGSFRRFALPDAIYIGGILNGIPNQYIQMNSNGITITDVNNNKITMKNGEIDCTTPLFKIIGNLEVTGTTKLDETLEVDGEITVTSGGLNITGAVNITGNTLVTGTFHATSTTQFDGNVTINGTQHTVGVVTFDAATFNLAGAIKSGTGASYTQPFLTTGLITSNDYLSTAIGVHFSIHFHFVPGQPFATAGPSQ